MPINRRTFLVRGVRVAAAAPFVSLPFHASESSRGSAAAAHERVLVVLQLTGGNDGLNTVVPHRQDAYYKSRPGLALSRAELVRLDDDHGLHPALAALQALHDDGRLAVVHGVGYPEPDRSHFRSLDIWHTGDPAAPSAALGWLGRLADQIASRQPGTLAALHVGAEDLPRALVGQSFFCPTLRSMEGFHLREPMAGFAAERARLIERTDGGDELRFLREAARGTLRAVEAMERLAERSSAVAYPDSELGRRLELIARLVAGGFGTRIFQLELGGFDTHARQRGPHAELLRTAGEALAAFQADLASAGAAERVVTLVFSEFGRRVQENGSGGTDHGAGAPVFLLGAPVRGGLHGTPPDLARLVDGDVPATSDLRTLYAELEHTWLGLEPSSDLPPLPLLAS